MSNLRSANKAHLVFTTRLTSSKLSLSVQEVSTQSFQTRIYPSLPLLNFLTILLLAIQRGSADIYKQLVNHYTVHIKEVRIWDDGLAQIGEKYFGIRIPRQGNPLFEMMGSMMGLGSSPSRKAEPAPPAAVDVDWLLLSASIHYIVSRAASPWLPIPFILATSTWSESHVSHDQEFDSKIQLSSSNDVTVRFRLDWIALNSSAPSQHPKVEAVEISLTCGRLTGL